MGGWGNEGEGRWGGGEAGLIGVPPGVKAPVVKNARGRAHYGCCWDRFELIFYKEFDGRRLLSSIANLTHSILAAELFF